MIVVLLVRPFVGVSDHLKAIKHKTKDNTRMLLLLLLLSS